MLLSGLIGGVVGGCSSSLFFSFKRPMPLGSPADIAGAVEEFRRQSLPHRVILVRHGESEGNADKTLYRDKADNLIQLTDTGKDQAVAAGRRIRAFTGEETVAFCSSPFRRTIETMKGIRAAWDGHPDYPSVNPKGRNEGAKAGWVYINSQLREQEFGNLQGEDFRTFRKEQERVGRFYYRFPTGESGADVFDRTKSWWMDELMNINCEYGTSPVDNIVVVTHGLTMRFILMMIKQWSPHTFETVWNADNCEIYVLKKDLSMPGFAPYRLDTTEGDHPKSSRKVCVEFEDGKTESLLLEDYMSIPPPRTRQEEVVRAMLAEQHKLEPGSIKHIDMYDGKFTGESVKPHLLETSDG